jgi:hypothetical protein
LPQGHRDGIKLGPIICVLLLTLPTDTARMLMNLNPSGPRVCDSHYILPTWRTGHDADVWNQGRQTSLVCFCLQTNIIAKFNICLTSNDADSLPRMGPLCLVWNCRRLFSYFGLQGPNADSYQWIKLDLFCALSIMIFLPAWPLWGPCWLSTSSSYFVTDCHCYFVNDCQCYFVTDCHGYFVTDSLLFCDRLS